MRTLGKVHFLCSRLIISLLLTHMWRTCNCIIFNHKSIIRKLAVYEQFTYKKYNLYEKYPTNVSTVQFAINHFRNYFAERTHYSCKRSGVDDRFVSGDSRRGGDPLFAQRGCARLLFPASEVLPQ